MKDFFALDSSARLAEWHKAAAVCTNGLVRFEWDDMSGRPTIVVWRTRDGTLAGYAYNNDRPFIWHERLGWEWTPGVVWSPRILQRRKFSAAPLTQLKRIRDHQLGGAVEPWRYP